MEAQEADRLREVHPATFWGMRVGDQGHLSTSQGLSEWGLWVGAAQLLCVATG